MPQTQLHRAFFLFPRATVVYFRTGTKEHEVNRRHLLLSSPEVRNVRGCCPNMALGGLFDLVALANF